MCELFSLNSSLSNRLRHYEGTLVAEYQALYYSAITRLELSKGAISMKSAKFVLSTLSAAVLGIVMLCLASAPAMAATATTTFAVTATVQATCSVTATPMAFGTYIPTAASTNTATVTVTCTNTTPYTLD